jgi:hypothetical protein
VRNISQGTSACLLPVAEVQDFAVPTELHTGQRLRGLAPSTLQSGAEEIEAVGAVYRSRHPRQAAVRRLADDHRASAPCTPEAPLDRAVTPKHSEVGLANTRSLMSARSAAMHHLMLEAGALVSFGKDGWLMNVEADSSRGPELVAQAMRVDEPACDGQAPPYPLSAAFVVQRQVRSCQQQGSIMCSL